MVSHVATGYVYAVPKRPVLSLSLSLLYEVERNGIDWCDVTVALWRDDEWECHLSAYTSGYRMNSIWNTFAIDTWDNWLIFHQDTAMGFQLKLDAIYSSDWEWLTSRYMGQGLGSVQPAQMVLFSFRIELNRWNIRFIIRIQKNTTI